MYPPSFYSDLGQPSSVCQSQWVEQGVTVHGVQGHSGQSKGITVQVNQVVPSAQVHLSTTAVQPVAADPAFDSMISCSDLSALFEAL